MVCCQFPDCKGKALDLCHCNYCQKDFCLKHRLPETHTCENINSLREKKLDLLKKNLMDNALREEKITNI